MLIVQAELITKYKDETLPYYLSKLEQLLISNDGGDGYFVGSEVSADISDKSSIACIYDSFRVYLSVDLILILFCLQLIGRPGYIYQ